MLKWAKNDKSNVAGEIALLSGLVMWVTTIPRIRRKMFELFFYTHQLYILFVIFFVFHVGFSYASIMLPSFYLFMVDRYLRFLQSRRGVRLVSARVLPCETVELNFSKTLGTILYSCISDRYCILSLIVLVTLYLEYTFAFRTKVVSIL